MNPFFAAAAAATSAADVIHSILLVAMASLFVIVDVVVEFNEFPLEYFCKHFSLFFNTTTIEDPQWKCTLCDAILFHIYVIIACFFTLFISITRGRA